MHGFESHFRAKGIFWFLFLENGDDNLIVGLCIDKVSLNEKVKVQDGVVEDKELLPHCVLLCLTVEGTLIMFNLARYF